MAEGDALADGTRLAREPQGTCLVLQGAEPARMAAGTAFGAPLPNRPAEVVLSGAQACLWQGPGEWLLLAPAEAGEALASRLADALAGIAHALVDVSSRQIAFALHGPGAARLLNAACALDLDPAAFRPGQATRTLVGRADVTLWRQGDELFHIRVARSLAPYLAALLTEAARDDAP